MSPVKSLHSILVRQVYLLRLAILLEDAHKTCNPQIGLLQATSATFGTSRRSKCQLSEAARPKVPHGTLEGHLSSASSTIVDGYGMAYVRGLGQAGFGLQLRQSSHLPDI